VVTTYTVLKTIHVIAVATWVGGGSILITLTARARRASDHAKVLTLVREIAWVGPRIFAGSAALALVTGFWMIYNFGWPYDLWIVLGLVGWGVTFVTGNFFLGPNSKKLEAAIEEKGATDPEALRLTGVLLNVARVDSLVLTLVIVDMVIKPT